jgi:hypothetical protein
MRLGQADRLGIIRIGQEIQAFDRLSPPPLIDRLQDLGLQPVCQEAPDPVAKKLCVPF